LTLHAPLRGVGTRECAESLLIRLQTVLAAPAGAVIFSNVDLQKAWNTHLQISGVIASLRIARIDEGNVAARSDARTVVHSAPDAQKCNYSANARGNAHSAIRVQFSVCPEVPPVNATVRCAGIYARPMHHTNPRFEDTLHPARSLQRSHVSFAEQGTSARTSSKDSIGLAGCSVRSDRVVRHSIMIGT